MALEAVDGTSVLRLEFNWNIDPLLNYAERCSVFQALSLTVLAGSWGALSKKDNVEGPEIVNTF
ncbi:hypothetical protein [Paracidovorax anthurii]|uniref:hypothetical protein n=1 Tax=Paracidovorax anthurii TaxID=78229 RepID=UPI0011BFA877|nr:hypothetical protein [Paracidovorax anthurii]